MPLRALAEPSPESEGGRAAPPLLEVSLHSTHSSVLLGAQLRRPRHKGLPDVCAGGGCVPSPARRLGAGFAVREPACHGGLRAGWGPWELCPTILGSVVPVASRRVSLDQQEV